MCETTDDADWRPFYLMDINRFPGVNRGEPTYGRLESCPDCTETRVRIVDPHSFGVVDDRGRSDEQSSDGAGTEGESVAWGGETGDGLDLTSPEDLVED